jgi:hypothetical protein
MKQSTARVAGLLLLGVVSSYGAAQVQLVAHTSATNTSNGTTAIDTTGANFIAVCETGPYGPVTPTDSVTSNQYVLAASAPNSGYWSLYLYVSYNPTTSTNETWTVNQGGYPATVEAFKGVAGADSKSVVSQTYSLVLPTITPTNPNELILSCFQPQAGSVSSPLTILDSTGGNSGISSAYQIQTSAAPLTPTWVEPGGAAQADVGLAASFYSNLSPAALVPGATLPEGYKGQPYSYQLPVTGGVWPYTWALTSGTLPAGLSMSSGGLISGTPTSPVLNSPVVFAVTDAHSNTSSTGTIPFTIAASQLAFASTTCPGGTQYQVYAGCMIAGVGGTAPYTYSWAGSIPWSGQLPPANGNYASLVEGLSLNSTTGAISGTIAGQGAYIVLFSITDSTGATVMQTIEFDIAGENTMAGCSYPADSIYYQNISQLPVDNSIAAQIYPGYVAGSIHAGFGQYGDGPDGIPFYKVPYNQPMVSVSTGDSMFPGNQGPIPFYAPMEGTRNGPGPDPINDYTGDNHVLILQTAGGGKGCYEWSMYDIYPNYPNTNNSWGGGLNNGQGGYSDGFWDMSGYSLTPQGQPGADAAGLPIIPLLETYDEVLGTGTPGAENGVIREVKRFTLEHTLRSYVWPATHQAGQGGCTGGYQDPNGNGLISQLDPPTACSPGGPTAPMGEIYRLKASVATPACAATSPQSRVIIQGFRDHGIILADNGETGAVIGTPDTRWNMNDLYCLQSLKLSDFEAVQVQQIAVNWPTSSQVIATNTPPTDPSGATVTVTGTGTVTLMANQAATGGYGNTSATVSFNVIGSTPALTFTPVPAQVYGYAPFTVSATSNSTGAITYSVVSGPATISGNTVTLTGIGTVTLQANQAAIGGYNAASTTTLFAVTGESAALNFANIPNQIYGAAPFTVSATSNSTGAITYSVISGPATISGNTVTLTAVGRVTLQASQAAAGVYAATTATIGFSVDGATPNLSFATIPSQTYGAAPFIVSATSNSTGAITYSVVSGPATISGSSVTLTGSGTVILQASQAAAGGYTATTATTSFNISGAAPALSFATIPGKTFGAAPFSISATSNSTGAITYSIVSGPATISGSTVTLTGSGTVTLEASQAAAGAYTATTATTTFNVSGATPTLTFATVPAQTFGAAPFSISATSNSTGAITYSIVSGPATISGSTVTLTGSGTVTLQASQAAAGGYTATTASISFNVSGATPTLSIAGIPSQTYGAAPFAISATSNSPGAITYSVVSGPATVSGNLITLTGIGTVAIQASQAASGGYVATTANASFSVSGAAPALIFPAVPNQTYGAAPFAVLATSNSTGAITYSVLSGPATIAVNTITLTGSGAVTVQASQAAAGGYLAATATVSFNVIGAVPTLTFAAISNQTYGAAPFAVSATSNSTGAITYTVVSGPATISGSTVTITGSGTVTLRASQAAAGGYAAATATTSFNVSNATPALTFAAVSNQVYGAAPFAVSATSNSTGAITYTVVSGPATVSGSTVTITGSGTVTLQASQAAAGGYAAATATTSFNVSSATPTLTFAAIPNQTYGNAPVQVSATSSSTGAITYTVVSGAATISGSTVTITGSGTVTLQASQAASGGYAAATATTSFTVSSATPTLTFAAVPSQTYGNAPVQVSATSNSTGAITYTVVSGPATISGNTVTITGSGTVTLQASQAAAGGYAAATSTTSFNVSSVTPTLTFAAVPNQLYGAAPFAISATSNSNGPITYSITSGPATISGSTVTLTGIGTVTLKASQAAAGGYAAATATTSFNVSSSTPVLTFATVPSQIYGTNPFSVSATSNSTGPITYSVTSGPATISGSTVTITGIGTVTLQASQAAAGGFNASTATTSFAVAPALPTLTFVTVPNQINGVAPFTVSATSNSTGTILYAVLSGPASIAGSTVTITGAGTVTLQASQAAAGNYAATTATTKFVVAPSPAGDFSLPSTFNTITITQGQTASFIVAITSLHGFAGTISINCGVPVEMLPANCTGTNVQLAASSTANTNIRVMTAPSQVATRESQGPLREHGRSLILLSLLAPLGLPLWKRRRGVWILLALAVVLAGGLTGCSGGVVQTTAAKGTYTLTVNATSGSISHSMNLTVVVQ